MKNSKTCNQREAPHEPAFRRLVEEHGGLVHQTALRRLNGDHAVAQDAAQTAFADLAQKAASLPDDTIVPAWLYRQTCFMLLERLDDLLFCMSFPFHLVLSALAARTNFSVTTVFGGSTKITDRNDWVYEKDDDLTGLFTVKVLQQAQEE